MQQLGMSLVPRGSFGRGTSMDCDRCKGRIAVVRCSPHRRPLRTREAKPRLWFQVDWMYTSAQRPSGRCVHGQRRCPSPAADRLRTRIDRPPGGQRARAEVNGSVALCLRLDQGMHSLAFCLDAVFGSASRHFDVEITPSFSLSRRRSYPRHSAPPVLGLRSGNHTGSCR